MPADIVNLNKFRKSAARAEKEKRAEENRAKSGRTKTERTKAADEQSRRNATLDGARRNDSDLEPGIDS